MAFMSPRLYVPCPQAEGKRGSGAPGKGFGKEGGFSWQDGAANSSPAPGCRPRGLAPCGKERVGHVRAAGSSCELRWGD